MKSSSIILFTLFLFSSPSFAQNCSNGSGFVIIDAQGDTIPDGGQACFSNLPLYLEPTHPAGEFNSLAGLLPGSRHYDPIPLGIYTDDQHVAEIRFTYILSSAVCTKTITILRPKKPTAFELEETYLVLCEGAANLPLTGQPNENGQFYLGEVSPETAIDVLPYATMADGFHEIICTYTDPITNCSSQQSSFVYKNVALDLPCNQDIDGAQFCTNEKRVNLHCPNPNYALFKAVNGAGVYIVDSTQTHYFDPILAGVGEHTIIYTYHSFGCPEPITKEVTVTVLDSIKSPCTVSVDINEVTIPDMITHPYAYPNPFSQQTTIQYHLTKSSLVDLIIYDVTGKIMTTVVQSEQQSVGTHSFSINAQDWAAGTYFYQINTEKHIQTNKLLLIK